MLNSCQLILRDEEGSKVSVGVMSSDKNRVSQKNSIINTCILRGKKIVPRPQMQMIKLRSSSFMAVERWCRRGRRLWLMWWWWCTSGQSELPSNYKWLVLFTLLNQNTRAVLSANAVFNKTTHSDSTNSAKTKMSTKSDPGFKTVLILMQIQMSADMLPECSGFVALSASVTSPSFVKIGRWHLDKW